MTTPATKLARVRNSARVYLEASVLGSANGLCVQRVTARYYRIFPWEDSLLWGIVVEPGKQEIHAAWGTPPTVDLPAEWNILGVVLAVVNTSERKDEA